MSVSYKTLWLNLGNVPRVDRSINLVKGVPKP